MKKQQNFFLIFLVLIYCFVISSCRTNAKENYKNAVNKYKNQENNTIHNNIYDDFFEDDESFMNKANQEIEKVMDEYK